MLKKFISYLKEKQVALKKNLTTAWIEDNDYLELLEGDFQPVIQFSLLFDGLPPSLLIRFGLKEDKLGEWHTVPRTTVVSWENVRTWYRYITPNGWKGVRIAIAEAAFEALKADSEPDKPASAEASISASRSAVNAITKE